MKKIIFAVLIIGLLVIAFTSCRSQKYGYGCPMSKGYVGY